MFGGTGHGPNRYREPGRPRGRGTARNSRGRAARLPGCPPAYRCAAPAATPAIQERGATEEAVACAIAFQIGTIPDSRVLLSIYPPNYFFTTTVVAPST